MDTLTTINGIDLLLALGWAVTATWSSRRYAAGRRDGYAQALNHCGVTEELLREEQA